MPNAARHRVSMGLFPAAVLGFSLWACGILSAFGERSILSPLALLVGSVVFIAGSFLLLKGAAENSGREPSGDRAFGFCVLYGLGLVALGYVIGGTVSPLAAVLAALVAGLCFLGGALLLLAGPRSLRVRLYSR